MTTIDRLTSRPWWPVLREWSPVLLAAVLGVVGILHHEWWRDEANPWLVARASSSITDLLDSIRFNGHPRLYYILVYLVQSTVDLPIVLSFLNLVLMLLALAFFVRSAPITAPQKLLFAVGIFPLYQYGVMARSYSLLLFALFWYGYLLVRRPDRTVTRLLVLSILPQVHLFGLTTAGALLLIEVWDARRSSILAWRPHLLGFLVLLVSMALSTWQMMPGDGDHVMVRRADLDGIMTALTHAFFPSFGIFNDGVVQQHAGLLAFGLGIVWWWGSWHTLARYLLLIASTLSVFLFVYSGFRWHFGMFYVMYLFCLTVAPRPPLVPDLARRFLTLLLALHAGLGLYALVTDIRTPYSNGQDAAKALQAPDKAGLPLVGIHREGSNAWSFNIDFVQPVLLKLPGQGIWDTVQQRYETSYKHYGTHGVVYESMDTRRMLLALHSLATASGTDLAVVISQGTGQAHFKPPAPLSAVVKFPQPFDFGENLTVCRYPLKNFTIQKILKAEAAKGVADQRNDLEDVP